MAEAFRRHRGSRAARPLPLRHFFAGEEPVRTIRFEVDLRLRDTTVAAMGGLEFAPAIAAALDPARVSPRHHADLRAFVAEIDRLLAAAPP